MKLTRRLTRLNDRLGLASAPPQVRAAITLIQLAFAACLAGVLLYFVVGALNGVVSAPGNGAEVMDSAREPNSFTFQIQSVRTFISGEDKLETQALRDGAIDIGAGKFQVLAVHVADEQLLLSGDGTKTVGRKGDGPLQVVTPTVTASQLLPPTPADIAAADPQIVTDTDTVRGQRAWRISFTLTPEIARKLFLADGLGLADADLDAISQGRFTTDWAYAYVTRREPSMVMLYTGFKLEGGVSYRFLVKYSLFNLTEVREIRL